MSDFSLFNAYRREHTQNNRGAEYCDIDYLLRFWKAQKGKYLRALFPEDSLIVERNIEYTRGNDELHNDMEHMLNKMANVTHQITMKFRHAIGISAHTSDYTIRREAEGNINYSIYSALMSELNNPSVLIENTINFDSIKYYYYCNAWPSDTITLPEVKLTFHDGKTIRLSEGMKFTRLMGQIAKVIDAEDLWEEFRIAHSQVLNQKKLTGKLCLSIHPLDYATASDNDNGWSSCMSWADEGCYRMGTVEMMNSPMVICAYVKSDKQTMSIGNKQWNSKKWRAWIIVDKDVIVCNRHYPYYQPEFATQAVQWVRDLVGAKYDWQYEDIHENFYSYMEQVHCEIDFETNYMYNDLGGDDVIGCLNIKRHCPGIINYSGEAECMICGQKIEPHTQEANCLECADCYAEYFCDCCGCVIDENNVFYGPNDEPLCQSCYEENCTTCTECDETVWADRTINVTLPVFKSRGYKYLRNASQEAREHFCNWRGDIRLPSYYSDNACLCPDCAVRYPIVDKDYTDDPDVNIDWVVQILDPNRISADDALDLINPNDWHWANSYGRRHSPETAEEIKNFWYDQWNAYKENFNKEGE